MKKLNFKGRKHAVTATCLLVGMFMLTSAAYANYDDARGYTSYKDAVKDLAFYQDNYTADGEMSILVDGEKMATIKGVFKRDGNDCYARVASEESFSTEKSTDEKVQVTKDGKTYYYYPETNSYMVSDSKIDFRPDMSDPTVKKGVRFAELFADAMVGDLKNNFTLESKDGDNRNYSVKVSGSQIPEVVNAGISLMFTAANNADMSQTSSVTYENEKDSNVQPKNDVASIDIMTMLGMDPYIDSAACNFTLNKDGKLIANILNASMTGVDSKGKKHTITMKADYKISDYGTTKVEDFDTKGKTQQK